MAKERQLINSLKTTTPQVVPIATDIILPNHSGIASHPQFKEQIGNYVLKSGDSMTGPLHITKTDSYALLVENDAGSDYLRVDTSSGVTWTRKTIPTSDSTYDLGDATHQWNNIYLDGSLVVNSVDLSSAELAYINGLNQYLTTTSTPTFDATTITSSSDNGLTLNYHSTHYLKLEPYTTSNHAPTLKSADFIYIAGQSTLGGYFGSSGFSYIDDKGMVLGSGGGAKACSIFGTTNYQRTGGTTPYIQCAYLLVPDTDYSAPNYIFGRYWLMCDYSDRTYSFNHGKQDNPTLFIHSANQSTTEWISLTHNQTDAVINSGAGDVLIATDLNVTGTYKISGTSGVTGSFTTVDGYTVTVTAGIITDIS